MWVGLVVCGYMFWFQSGGVGMRGRSGKIVAIAGFS